MTVNIKCTFCAATRVFLQKFTHFSEETYLKMAAVYRYINLNSSLFQTFALFWMLYSFFWVIPRRMNFICRRFGTFCPTFIGGLSLHHLWRWKNNVPKRRHKKFRRRGVTQKKEYSLNSCHFEINVVKKKSKNAVLRNCDESNTSNNEVPQFLW